jgi:ribosomal-protein-serine acetyltransferase
MNRFEILADKDLVLRTWEEENADELFALTDKNRSQLQRWLAWVPETKSREDSLKFIQKCLKEYEEESGLELGIWYQNKLVGCIGLHGFNKTSHRANLGYWLDQDYQGKGIITQAAKNLIEYGFKTRNLNRIGLEAGTENSKSRAVAERLGFAQEGVLRKYDFLDGRFVDYAIYGLLREEWK